MRRFFLWFSRYTCCRCCPIHGGAWFDYGRYTASIRGKGKIARFMEQVYTAMYFAVFGPFGLWVMSRTNIWYFNTTAMFEDFLIGSIQQQEFKAVLSSASNLLVPTNHCIVATVGEASQRFQNLLVTISSLLR